MLHAKVTVSPANAQTGASRALAIVIAVRFAHNNPL
jgi:hypothetical protein